MQYDQKQFTQKGLDMFTQALSNKQSITVDKVIVDDLPTNNFSNLALLSLDSFADAMSFQANYTETSNNTLTVDAVMSNKGFTSSYTINELGLVGHIGDDVNNQSLMAVLVASDPFTLPAQQNNETPSQFIPNITIQLANNDMGQVPVLVQDDAYIAQKDLDKLVSDDGYIKLTDADNRYVKQTDFNNNVDNYFDGGQIKNGYNLNNYTWNGSFTLYDVDIGTLIGNDGISKEYSHFYGVLKVETYGNYTRQFLYDNINNVWYRYSGDSNYWRKIATNDDLNYKADKSYVDQNINQTNNEVNDKANQSDLNATNNELESHFGTGEIKNGYNLNNYTWSGSFYLTDVNIDALIGHDGIAPGYEHFYGKMLVDDRNGYIIQTLYDNTNNEWYRYVGSSVTWHHIATDDNINTINSRIDSLNDGKNDKVDSTNKFEYLNGTKADAGDTQGRINQVLSQATAHSDQNYNDLSNKNDILSSNLKSATNDLADKYNRSYYDAPNLSSTTNTDYSGYGWGKILDFPVEAGKKYWISAYSNEHDSWDLETVYDNSQSKMTNTGFFSRSFIADSTKNMPIVPYNDSGNGGNLTRICITQSDDYVPFEVAQRNRLWNNRITNKTDILSDQLNSHFGTGTIQNGYNLNNYTWNGTFNLYGVDIGTLIGNDGLPKDYNGFYGIMVVEVSNGYAYQILYDNINNQWFRYVGNGVTWHQVATHDDVQSKYDSLNDAKQDKSNSTDKFNWMNTVKHNTADANQQFDQAIAHADWAASSKEDGQDATNKFNYLNGVKADKNSTYTKADVDTRIEWAKADLNNNKEDGQDSTNKFNYLNGVKASTTDVNNKINQLASNSWRELSVNGLSSHIGGSIFCKVDWNSNTATLSGMSTNGRSPSGNNDVITIVSSNDFSFTNFSGNVTEFKSQEEGTWNSDTVSVNAIGGNLISGINNGAFNITLTMATETGQSITVPIQPK